MKILVMSDLHLETGPLHLVKAEGHPGDTANVVILAGDIDEGTHDLRWRESFPKHEIIYVAGNHEYYWGTMEDV